MKKIAYFALSFSILAAVACKNNDATSQKIDFTQSYENAALALTSAQNNYNTALTSNDTSKINIARKELETATTNYVTSKNDLIKNGGTVKQEYESNLTKSEQTLSKIIPAATTSTKPDSAIGGKVGQAINNGTKKVDDTKNAVHSTATNVIDKANNAVQNIAAKKAKTQDNIKKAGENFQKNIEDTKAKGKKLNEDVKNLFK